MTSTAPTSMHYTETSPWSLESFCASQISQPTDAWQNLPSSSREFLKRLGLPSRHPFCTDHGSLLRPLVAPMGPATDFHSQSLVEALNSAFWYQIPPLASLVYLLVALLAVYLAPLGLLYLAWKGMSHRASEKIAPLDPSTEIIFHITFVFSWILLTDDQYVLGIGRWLGLGQMVGLMVLGACHRCRIRVPSSFFCRLSVILILAYIVSPWRLLDPNEVQKVSAGLYFNEDNPLVQSILEHWNVPDYERLATRWQFTGDARTGLPYLMNFPRRPVFHRVWLSTDDHEVVALDISFPETGHNSSCPLYLVLHGLNGGSTEGYVMDLVSSRVHAGSTVVVLVARGLMDTPIQGLSTFNGIRTTDAHSAASVLRDRVLIPNQTLAGVGYSMGAIVLNRYVATHHDVALNVSVSISGALNTIYQMNYLRSKFTWQRIITAHMKELFFKGKWGRRLHNQLGDQGYVQLLRAQNIVESDYFTGVILCYGYKDLVQFYTAMSSILAHKGAREEDFGIEKSPRRRVPIPHAVLQAMDDPISTWRGNASNDPKSALYHNTLTSAKHQENIVLLLTRIGGHVGWPIGMFPSSWFFMNDIFAAGFITAYDMSQKQNDTS